MRKRTLTGRRLDRTWLGLQGIVTLRTVYRRQLRKYLREFRAHGNPVDAWIVVGACMEIGEPVPPSIARYLSRAAVGVMRVAFDKDGHGRYRARILTALGMGGGASTNCFREHRKRLDRAEIEQWLLDSDGDPYKPIRSRIAEHYHISPRNVDAIKARMRNASANRRK